MSQKTFLTLTILGIIIVGACVQQSPAPTTVPANVSAANPDAERPQFKSLNIVLSSGCQVGGSRFTIRNNSAVFYWFRLMREFDLRKGNLADAKIGDIIETLDKNDFFSLNEGYERYYATDLCHTTLTVDLDDRAKTVKEYGTQGPDKLHNIQTFLTDVAKNLPQSTEVGDCGALDISVKTACYDYFAAKNCNFNESDKAAYAEDFLVNILGREYYDEHYKLYKIERDYVWFNLTFPGIDPITDSFLEVKDRFQDDVCSWTVSNSYILKEPVNLKMTKDEAIKQCTLARNETVLGYDSIDYHIGEDFIGDYGVFIRFRNETQRLMVLCEANLNTGTVLTTKDIYRTGS